MNILAVSYMLPPSLYPQSIQIGRLLYYSHWKTAVVSGNLPVRGMGMDCYEDFNNKVFKNIVVGDPSLLNQSPLWKLIGRLFPLLGKSPDELGAWVIAAERSVQEYLSTGAFIPDRLITFGEPMSDHLLGLRLKRMLSIPWVAHFSDPWADNPFRHQFSLARFSNARLERKVIEMADKIIFTSSETRDLVMKKYPKDWSIKTYVLPHSYDKSLYPVSLNRSNSGIVVRYIGSFYKHRNPYSLFDAILEIFKSNPNILKDVTFEIVGGIPKRMLKHASYKALPVGFVKVVPTVGYRDSLKLMKQSDLLLVIDAGSDISVFLPSKLVDYLGAGVPILGIVPKGSSASLIQRMGGSVADPGDLRAIAATLAQALELCRSVKKSGDTKPWGREDVRQEYAVGRVEKQFLEILSHGGPA
jgi:glycosyltransferase involved in cell wall biosynthesis